MLVQVASLLAALLLTTKTNDGDNPATHDGGLVVTAVPEPEVYLMFLADLSLVGYRAKKHLLK